jgi:hypothetical protein
MPGQELSPERASIPGADATAPGAGAAMAPPAGTPSAGEHEKKGESEQAKANVQIAISILEQSLPQLGSDSEEGAIVLKALSMLSKSFAGKKSGDLAASEHLQTMAGMPDSIKAQMMKEMGAGGQQAGGPPAGGMMPGM